VVEGFCGQSMSLKGVPKKSRVDQDDWFGG
jgi:hypothetical protein